MTEAMNTTPGDAFAKLFEVDGYQILAVLGDDPEGEEALSVTISFEFGNMTAHLCFDTEEHRQISFDQFDANTAKECLERMKSQAAVFCMSDEEADVISDLPFEDGLGGHHYIHRHSAPARKPRSKKDEL
jgi:hypothetical protein